jgi:hypothetical protein
MGVSGTNASIKALSKRCSKPSLAHFHRAINQNSTDQNHGEGNIHRMYKRKPSTKRNRPKGSTSRDIYYQQNIHNQFIKQAVRHERNPLLRYSPRHAPRHILVGQQHYVGLREWDCAALFNPMLKVNDMIALVRIRPGSIPSTQWTAPRTTVGTAIGYLWSTLHSAVHWPNVSACGPTKLWGELVQLNGVVKD